MPAHVALAHLLLAVAPLTAVVALVYAAVPRARRALRWPLLGTSLLAFVLVVWAGEVGGRLLESLEATAGAQEVARATEHGHAAGALAAALLCLLGLAVAGGWWLLRPGRPSSSGAVALAALLVVAAGAVLVTTWTTTADGLQAVWDAAEEE